MSKGLHPTLDLSIPGELSRLPGAAAAVDGLLTRAGLPPEVIGIVHLALDELAANVMRWSAADRVPEIRIRATVEPAHVRLVIEDDGPPFDPRTAPSPDVESPLAERREGGLGIHLVRNLVDELAYARVGPRNVVDIRVARDRPAAPR